MARHYPDVVRREFAAGHTIGTHSQNHPLRFQKLSGDNLRREIDYGIASVSVALGDPKDLAPYFRIPGLYRTDEIERELAARSLVTFSADVDADDWHRHITPDQITKLAMSRLEKRGKGSILLLHDIHPATVAALPGLLKELKGHGYHIVQVVPPAPTEPKTAGEPKAWPMPGMPDQIFIYDSAAPSWPQSNASLALDNITGPELPVPSVQDIGVSLQGQILGAEPGAKSNLHRHKQLLAYHRISSLPRQYSGHQSEKDRSWLNGRSDQKYKGERDRPRTVRHARRPSQREEKRQSGRLPRTSLNARQ
jgi:peptidoglycan-N-acetylglucosamine deacetylase